MRCSEHCRHAGTGFTRRLEPFRPWSLPGRRQIAGSVLHLSDDERYRRLNDVMCVCGGEVRVPGDPAAESPDLVIDVAELVWEPIAE